MLNKHLLRLSVNYPWTIIVITLLITGSCLFAIPGINLRLDGRSLIPEHHPDFIHSDSAESIFALNDVVYIGVHDQNNIYTPGNLQSLRKLSEVVGKVDGIIPSSFSSILTVPGFATSGEELDLRSVYNSANLSDTAACSLLRKRARNLLLNDGVLVSEDGRTAALFAEIFDYTDRYKLVSKLDSVISSTQYFERVALSGSAVAQGVLGQAVLNDLLILAPITILLIGVLLTLVFKSYWMAAVALIEVGTAVIWTFGLIAITGQPVFITTLILPVVLIIIGVSDDIYAINSLGNLFSNQLRRVERRKAMVAALQKVSRPISTTMLTTTIGLLSLTITDVEPLRIFGLFGAFSVCLSSFFTFTLVPALIAVSPSDLLTTAKKFKVIQIKWPDIFLSRLLIMQSWIGILFFSSIILIGVTSLPFLKTNDSWIGSLPVNSNIVESDHFLNERLAGTTTLELLVDGQSDNRVASAEFLVKLGGLQQKIRNIPGVGAVQGVYDDFLRTFAINNDLNFSKCADSLKQIVGSIGPSEVQQTFLLITSLDNSPIPVRWDRMLRRTWITVFINNADYQKLEAIVSQISSMNDWSYSVIPFGDGWFGYKTVQLAVNGQLISIISALALDFLLVSLLLRSWRMGILAIMPVAASIVMVFSLMAMVGIPLGIANSMFAAVAIGISVDYSIHLLVSLRRNINNGMNRVASLTSAYNFSSRSILQSAFILGAGFTVFLFSNNKANMSLGLLVSISLITCAVMTLVIVPLGARMLKIV